MRRIFLPLLLAALPLRAQNGTPPSVPFAIGESMVYNVKYGPLTVGNGRMEVAGIDTIRGRPAWHLRLEVRAGIPGFRVVNVLESWLDVVTLSSLRYRQESNNGGKEDRRVVEMYPDQGVYQETDWRVPKGGSGLQETRKPNAEMVAEPLDQASFLFFARTLSLDAGRSYSYSRFYKPANNPVTLSVLRRESVNVPAGRFNAVVIRPVFKSNGIFGQGGKAQVWFTDDERRMMVKMETQVAFGSITLQLSEFQSGMRP
jgi:hypothetical protein